jgi:hypothetical protein
LRFWWRSSTKRSREYLKMKRLNDDPRSLLSLRLDGEAVESSATVRQVHSTFLSHYEPQFPQVFDWLRQMPAGDLLALPSHCDVIAAVFDMAGASPVSLTDGARGSHNPGMIIAGCSRQSIHLPAGDPVGFMKSGGVLVTSDRSIASVHLPPGLISLRPPAAPGRARLSSLANDAGLFPAVALAAGHIPVSVDYRAGSQVQVLAADCLTGLPVVIAVQVGRGWLLHSVAHWYQHCPAPATAVERRPARLRGNLSPVAELPAGASLGLVDAVRSMLSLLLNGLEIVLEDRRH